MDSGTDVSISGHNIDKYTGMNPQGPILATISGFNSAINCNIFNSVRRTFYLDYRVLTWYGAAKIEIENLVGNNIFENAEHKNNFEVEKVGRKNSVIWNYKSSHSIQVDPNHTESNKPIPDYSKNIGSINDLSNIHAIEKILSSLVHLVHTPYPVPNPRIFTYGRESDPLSP